MEEVVRAFPVKSKEAIVELAAEIDRKFTSKDKAILAEEFGLDCERWYYQEIAGKPHVIGVARGSTLELGFANWGKTKNPYATWFRAQVLEISGVDLAEKPKGPPTELLYELRA